jgi:hypothetical protein
MFDNSSFSIRVCTFTAGSITEKGEASDAFSILPKINVTTQTTLLQ